ncbi:MAG TPA: VWA domain-containing protein [Acidobacteriota bacterium]|nr:VWA domain-containing protein [Acidobacteriota bacterium]
MGRTLLASMVVTLLFCTAPADAVWAQDATASDQTPRFKASVEQVVLYVSVYNEEGHLVPGLPRERFRVFEDKVEQEITYFGLDDVPSTIGVVMDSSGSMRGRFDMVNRATSKFLDNNHPDNELFLIEFKSEVSLEESFTRDPADIRDALDNMIISGGTALYDAIFLAVDHAKEGSEPKKALLVFTDGEDKDSFYKHEELLDKVREADTQIFIVAFLAEDLEDDGGGLFGVFKGETAKEKVQREIREIAEYTGGQAFFPQEIGELDALFAQVASDLRNQYRIAYVPSKGLGDGEWRDVDVVLQGAREEGLKVRVRKGYYAK